MIEVLKKVLSECAEYITELRMCPKGYFLYRGWKSHIDDVILLGSRLDHRPPSNMPDHLHEAVNKMSEKQFGWKIRNGVFCYGFTSLGEIPVELGYGKQYLCFPVGTFSFIYSPDHFDMVGHFHEKKYNVSDAYIEKLSFKTDSLMEAIDSNKYRNGLSNEISINVPTYYLVDIKHREDLANWIWS